MTATVEESCCCGATFRYVGTGPYTAASSWRSEHVCLMREPKKPKPATREAS